MKNELSRYVCLLLLSGCAVRGPGAPAPVAVGAPSGGRLVLAVRGAVQGRAGLTAVTDTKVLHSGDELYLLLTASAAGFAYVAYCDARGELKVYPQTGSLALVPGQTVRVPAEDTFVTDTFGGEERLYVLASSSPLAFADPGLSREIAAAQQQQVERSVGARPCVPQFEITTAESLKLEQEPKGSSKPEPSPARPAAGRPPPQHHTHRVAQTSNAPGGPPDDGVSPRTVAPLAIPEVIPEYRPRGLYVRTSAPEAQTMTDDAGIAIYALRFTHKD